MCGIIGAINLKKDTKLTVNDWCINTFEDQHKRGMQGFGIAGLTPENKIKVLRATEPTKFMYDIHNFQSRMLLVHHRIPTSTENKLSQTHPIAVFNKNLLFKYLVIHNGIISNDDDLFKIHKEEGFDYTTYYKKQSALNYTSDEFNDSESLAIELAIIIDGLKKNKENLQLRTQGGAAFIVMQLSNEMMPLNLYWGKNSYNPLHIAVSQTSIRMASESKGEMIKDNVLYSQSLTEEMVNIKELALIIPERAKSTTIGFNYPIPIKTTNAKKEVEKNWEEEESWEKYQSRQDTKMPAEDEDDTYEPTETEIEEMINDTVDEAQTLVENIVQETILAFLDEEEVWKFDTEEAADRIRQILLSVQEQIQNLQIKEVQTQAEYELSNKRTNIRK